MHPIFIKAALKLAETEPSMPFTPSHVARHIGASPKLVFDVINGKRRSDHVERQIAWFTGLKLCELWPQHYAKPITYRVSKALDALRAALG
ncbi:MAG: hypothetical protein J0H50_14775 [Xanthomonadales bacterium]|nr:hypothetical protein [Xanthomonadales bacterium]